MGPSARTAGRNGPSRHQETVLIYGHASPKMRQRSADRMEQYIKDVLWDQHEGKYDKGQIKAENKAESLETLVFQGSPWRRRRDSNPRYPYGVYTISNRARSTKLRDFSTHQLESFAIIKDSPRKVNCFLKKEKGGSFSAAGAGRGAESGARQSRSW